ncbi:pectinesterase [Algoriella xinjiangensis]|uniref:Pectinesterase n=1 Tax=Algoriella xinjiangensis TaxID=684065 RepID=A0A1I4SFG1_9FLAO|nr:alpha/beta hydrolase [Algoriella xinjiangensis]SFM63219.1 pectinesterase [Algoriella xinjiangensis]VDH16041.1 Acetyl esterase [Algoriella xinjiangensis]
MNLFREYFLYVFFMLNIVAFGQIERPKATPYTAESTFLHLKKKYPFIKPVNKTFPTTVARDENIIYTSFNGTNLMADVYYPSDIKVKKPAIILVHGGGWISGSKENQQIMAQQLAANGYIAMAINYSLSDAAKYPAAVHDIEKAVSWLKSNRKKYGNNTKIAILGASAGAQLATLVGVKKENKIDAIINIDGIVSFIHPEAEEGQYAAYWFGATKNQNIKLWTEASPLEYVSAKTPPTLFINSSQPRFHAGRDDMISKLAAYKIDYEVHEIKDSPHSFWLVEPWFDETLNYIVNFMNKLFK